jgi:hypothetical protein
MTLLRKTVQNPVFRKSNIGMEYNLASADNLTALLINFQPGKHDNDFVHAANLQYTNKKWLISWQHQFVGKNYIAEVGYVPRKNYIKLNPSVGYLFS